MYLFLRSESHGLVTSGASVCGGRRPLPVPRSCGTGPGAPPPTAAEVAQTFRQSLQNKHKECPDGFVSIILKTLIPIKKMGELLKELALTNRNAWGKVSLKSLEITSDNRAVSHRLSAFS